MLKVIPKAWSYAFSVTDGTESVAQAVDLSFWRDKGELRIQGYIYKARRDRSSYVLESAAGVLARAERPRRWLRELGIEHSGHRDTLRAKSPFRRQLLLLESSTQIGSISPEGLFTRKAEVELPQALPLFLKVFIIWLAMTIWKQDDYAGG
jgi:hypothetical protein